MEGKRVKSKHTGTEGTIIEVVPQHSNRYGYTHDEYKIAWDNGNETTRRKDEFSVLKTPVQLTPEEQKRHDAILKPYKFEIEETYREEGQRAGDRLVASILRQEGFEPTSMDESVNARQSVQNEMAEASDTEKEDYGK